MTNATRPLACPAIPRHNEAVQLTQVHLEIPEDLAALLAKDPVSLSRVALEALAIEGVRAGSLSVSQARRLLGIESRFEMDGVLKNHGVYLDLTFDDVRRDSEVAWIHHG